MGRDRTKVSPKVKSGEPAPILILVGPTGVGKTDVSLHLARRLGRSWTLSLAGENLLDEEVETGRDATGLVRIGAPRSVRLGLRWEKR